MTIVVGTEALLAIWDALELAEPSRRPMSLDGLLKHIADEGWASSANVEDILYSIEPRIDWRGRLDADELLKALDIQSRNVFYRPRRLSNSVYGSDAIAAEDVAEFLIQLERLGLNSNPKPLVDELLPQVNKLRRLTQSGLSILWYEKQRHKCHPIALQASEKLKAPSSTKKLKTSHGYRAELWLDEVGAPIQLVVSSPSFRRRQEPVETTCPECGDVYFRGDPESSQGHRKEHKKRMAVLDPKPHAKFLEARDDNCEPELVTMGSPKWKHAEIYERARFFKREFGYDFVQWESPKGDGDPHAHGYLLADRDGAIVGACAFRSRDGENTKHWGMQWIWICPRARRTRVLTRHWPAFRKRFGDFRIEGPVSAAMEAFVVKQGDAKLLGYDPAKRTEGQNEVD